ncbi:NAD(P)-dependent oxidoreductase [Sphingomonas bacterium]|uniref:NAD(P)-dependent oxidoreductase n=1 Tax=Sphingomonas bacterium TaxID=1895847 RepID=UPI001575326F|nr:SDR family oxidoreductase [Sphingomonas bacterium]
MNILVFGATGLTGKQLVAQAIAHGHRITAFVRSGDGLAGIGGDLHVVTGDITDRKAVDAAVKGQDAVVSTLGAAKPWRHTPAIVQGVAAIIAAMQANGAERFVYQSALGVGDSRGAARGRLIGLMIPLMLHAAYEDHAVDERAIRGSGLAWTIVRPALLTNGKATGKWTSGPNLRDRFPLSTIARADVAAFILRAVERSEDVRQAINLIG